MELFFGQGVYKESNRTFEGQIVLSDHKLFLKNGQEDLTKTYVPLEKIERIKKKFSSLEIYVRPSMTSKYSATFKGERRQISQLLNEIVHRRQLKKKFLKQEWIEKT